MNHPETSYADLVAADTPQPFELTRKPAQTGERVAVMLERWEWEILRLARNRLVIEAAIYLRDAQAEYDRMRKHSAGVKMTDELIPY